MSFEDICWTLQDTFSGDWISFFTRYLKIEQNEAKRIFLLQADSFKICVHNKYKKDNKKCIRKLAKVFGLLGENECLRVLADWKGVLLSCPECEKNNEELLSICKCETSLKDTKNNAYKEFLENFSAQIGTAVRIVLCTILNLSSNTESEVLDSTDKLMSFLQEGEAPYFSKKRVSKMTVLITTFQKVCPILTRICKIIKKYDSVPDEKKYLIDDKLYEYICFQITFTTISPNLMRKLIFYADAKDSVINSDNNYYLNIKALRYFKDHDCVAEGKIKGLYDFIDTIKNADCSFNSTFKLVKAYHDKC